MNISEFRQALKRDREKIEKGEPPSGLAGCGHCGVPLQETLTGCREYDGKNLCSDCYFDALGDELEAHPIRAFRVVRGV